MSALLDEGRAQRDATPVALLRHPRSFDSFAQHTTSMVPAGFHSSVIGGTPLTTGRRDILRRWFDAWAVRPEADELEKATTTLNILRGENSKTLELNPPSAWDAAQQLRTWLGVTFGELSSMTGIGTSTFHSWSASDVIPRPSKVQGLWRLYTFARILQARLGPMDAAAWLRAGDPSPLRMLLDGHGEDVEALAYRSVLRAIPMETNTFMSARLEDASGEQVATRPIRTPTKAHRARRPVTKARPKARD